MFGLNEETLERVLISFMPFHSRSHFTDSFACCLLIAETFVPRLARTAALQIFEIN